MIFSIESWNRLTMLLDAEIIGRAHDVERDDDDEQGEQQRLPSSHRPVERAHSVARLLGSRGSARLGDQLQVGARPQRSQPLQDDGIAGDRQQDQQAEHARRARTR